MKLHEMAKVLRSKSAGPFKVTLDVFFESLSLYEHVRNSGVLTKELVAELYNIRPEEVEGIYFVDMARGIKITIPKPQNEATGDPHCRDIYGAQQYIPLLNVEIV